MPPTLADRPGSAFDREFEPKVGEGVAHASERAARHCRHALGPFASGQRGHSAEQTLRGSPHEPDMAVTLDPVSDAAAEWTDALGLRSRKQLGIARSISCAVLSQWAFVA